MKTAEEILRTTEPEGMFPGEVGAAKREYLGLAKVWHPDTNHAPEAGRVFAHIRTLYDDAIQRLNGGTWRGASWLTVVDYKGMSHTIDYLRSRGFELGQEYLGHHELSYLIEPTHRTLIEIGMVRYRGLRYTTSDMQTKLAPCFPTDMVATPLKDGRIYVRIPKHQEQLQLSEVQRAFGGRVPAVHVAWILRRLYNISCYFQHIGLVHHHLSLETCVVNPEHHTLAVLGGWWYAHPANTPISKIPKRTYEVLPWAVRTQKRADLLTDQELIRAIGRELLGDRSGRTMDCPAPMKQWLMQPAQGSPIAQYEGWDAVLTRSFGPRKFVPLDLNSSTLY